MCGICGLSPSLTAGVDKEVIERMKQTLRHRGPDGEGSYFSSYCVLGHRRLSVIDHAYGKQPMTNEDKTIWVVCNGEIYNYRHLWEILEKKGHHFSSNHSDTEVIIHGYEEWNTDIFKKLNGIFALAIWDEKNNVLVLGRDHIGVKPLYYAIRNGRLYFASEPKAILTISLVSAEFNEQQLAPYFFFRAPIHPQTLFKGVYKVNPGSYLIWKPREAAVSECQYWYPQRHAPFITEEKKIIQSLEQLLADSISGQLMSDVSLGVFLSGGVDSSIIAATASRSEQGIEGFLIRSEGKYDEKKWSSEVAEHLAIKNNILTVNGNDYLKNIDDWVYFNDDPVSDPSSLALFLLSRFARDKGNIVMLSGEGGDELFGGYNSYKRFSVYNTIKKIPFAMNSLQKFMKLSGYGNYRESDYSSIGLHNWDFLGTAHACSFNMLSSIITADINALELVMEIVHKYNDQTGESINRSCIFDQRVRLCDDLLARTDRASMANGLEARVPLLDYRLIEFANSLTADYKIRRWCSKYLLKKILAKYIPEHIVYRKKIGFYLPFEKWLKNDFVDKLRQYICEKKIPYINYPFIHSLVENYLHGKSSEYNNVIWSYLLLEQWYRRWIVATVSDEKYNITADVISQ